MIKDNRFSDINIRGVTVHVFILNVFWMGISVRYTCMEQIQSCFNHCICFIYSYFRLETKFNLSNYVPFYQENQTINAVMICDVAWQIAV